MSDQNEDEAETDLDDVPPDQVDVNYELDDWATESRELLDRLLTTNGVTHAWQGGMLTVGGQDEATTDDLIAEVEATLVTGLDPESEKVIYEVAEWSPEDKADLTDALAEEGVRYAFDEMGDLLVEAIDEDRVDTLIEELVDGDDDEDDAPEASDVLSNLFIAADKLRKNPRESRAIGSAIEGATAVTKMSPPYGVERATWAKVGLRSGALRKLLEEADAEDEAVTEAAGELRDLLHRMV